MNNKIVNELNENDLIELARLLKLYSCISNNYKDNKFDVDLKFGEKFEKSFAKILSVGKVEVKTERDIWKRTGNIAIELASRGKLSGLNTTKAEWWAQVLTIEGNIEGVLMFPVIFQLLTPKVVKGIMAYVFEKNDLDLQMESVRERLDKLEKSNEENK